MSNKQITVSIRGVDAEYWHTVREFALHRRTSLKNLVLVSIDQYMARYKRKERRQAKEA